MQAAIDLFQRRVFIFLLYISGFGGILSDIFLNSERGSLYALYDVLMITLGVTSLSVAGKKLSTILLFLVICFIINMSYAEVTAMTSLNGMREILGIMSMVTFYNKVFSEGNEDLAEDYIGIVTKYAPIFLVLQIPAAFSQNFRFGPSDYVGGTIGYLGSGILSLELVCLVYFMHFFVKSIKTNALLYFALIPMFLNETKVSFILIPMMVLFIFIKLDVKNILIGVGGAIGFFLLFNQFYAASYLDFDNSAAGIFTADFLSNYLMGDIYTFEDVPRATKIIIGWNLLLQDLNMFFFGVEYGLFKGGKLVEMSSFSQTYHWVLVGTRPYFFFLFMQGGLLLITGFFWLIFYINKFFKNVNKFQMFLVVVLLLIMIYNDSLRNANFITIFFFLMFFANSKFYTGKLGYQQ